MTINDDAAHTEARTFREAGYVVLEDVFAPDWVASLRAAYDALVARYLSDRGGLEALEGKTFGKNHVGIHPALFPPWSDPQIVAHPRIDALITEMLGADYRCGYYHTNAAYPGSGVQPVHRDTAPLFPGTEMSVPHPAVSVVLNIPLCDFTIENGSTEVWSGSHLIVDRLPEDGKALEARAAALPSARTNVPVGGASDEPASGLRDRAAHGPGLRPATPVAGGGLPRGRAGGSGDGQSDPNKTLTRTARPVCMKRSRLKRRGRSPRRSSGTTRPSTGRG